MIPRAGVLGVVLAGALTAAACGGKNERASGETAPEESSTAARRASSAAALASTALASTTSPPSALPTPRPTAASYTVHAEGREHPHLTIDSVRIDAKETALELTFENRTPKSRVISLALVGPEAMFIEAGGKRYALMRTARIAEPPEKDTIKPKEKRSFTLVFEPLPIETTSFDMYEGEAAKKPPTGKATLWAFVDVRLDAAASSSRGAPAVASSAP